MPIIPHLIEFETDGEAADQPSIESSSPPERMVAYAPAH
jgi:hypothetical protein